MDGGFFFEYAGAHFLGQKKALLLCGSLCDRGRVASVICKTLGGSRVLLVIDESQVMRFAERACILSTGSTTRL